MSRSPDRPQVPCQAYVDLDEDERLVLEAVDARMQFLMSRLWVSDDPKPAYTRLVNAHAQMRVAEVAEARAQAAEIKAMITTLEAEAETQAKAAQFVTFLSAAVAEKVKLHGLVSMCNCAVCNAAGNTPLAPGDMVLTRDLQNVQYNGQYGTIAGVSASDDRVYVRFTLCKLLGTRAIRRKNVMRTTTARDAARSRQILKKMYAE